MLSCGRHWHHEEEEEEEEEEEYCMGAWFMCLSHIPHDSGWNAALCVLCGLSKLCITYVADVVARIPVPDIAFALPTHA